MRFRVSAESCSNLHPVLLGLSKFTRAEKDPTVIEAPDQVIDGFCISVIRHSKPLHEMLGLVFKHVVETPNLTTYADSESDAITNLSDIRSQITSDRLSSATPFFEFWHSIIVKKCPNGMKIITFWCIGFGTPKRRRTSVESDVGQV